MSTPTDTPMTQDEAIASLGNYGYGWHDSDTAGAAAQRGLSEAVVRNIPALKSEPEWIVITSYSIHYTKLYEARSTSCRSRAPPTRRTRTGRTSRTRPTSWAVCRRRRRTAW